jgi:hypothetical protein
MAVRRHPVERAVLHPAASQLKVAAFSGGRLTTYNGTRYGFSGYFTTSPLIMTGPGSVTEANAGR